jgi:hypothetical protein
MFWIIDKQFDHMIFVCKQLITAGHMRPLYGHVPCYSLMLIYNWIFNLIWHSYVTEISITTDRKEQVMLFIIMAASFTYNLIKLVLGPMEIFFIIIFKISQIKNFIKFQNFQKFSKISKFHKFSKFSRILCNKTITTLELDQYEVLWSRV